MPALVLVGYATRYGSTQEVAEAIAGTLREAGLAVDLQPLQEVRSLDRYGAVVMGASLYMYRWHKDARQFLSRHRQTLTEQPVAVFALGPVHDPYDEQEWQDSRAQLEKELAKAPWFNPVAKKVFGGKFDPATLRGAWKLIPARDKLPAGDLRDWDDIAAWARSLPERLGIVE